MGIVPTFLGRAVDYECLHRCVTHLYSYLCFIIAGGTTKQPDWRIEARLLSVEHIASCLAITMNARQYKSATQRMLQRSYQTLVQKKNKA
jgi:hypothetical protein